MLLQGNSGRLSGKSESEQLSLGKQEVPADNEGAVLPDANL